MWQQLLWILPEGAVLMGNRLTLSLELSEAENKKGGSGLRRSPSLGRGPSDL